VPGIGKRIDDRVRVVILKRVDNYRRGEYVTVSGKVADGWIESGIARPVDFRAGVIQK
jgi:hypothetical protein